MLTLTPQQASSPALREKFAQALWSDRARQPTPSMWETVKQALPRRSGVLKGISRIQDGMETAKLLWQAANYAPQYQVVQPEGLSSRAPLQGNYYY